MNDTIEIIQALEGSNILHKAITKRKSKMKQKKQEGGFLATLVGTLGSILLGNSLSGKEIVRAGSGNKKGKGIAKACYGKEWDFFIPHPPLTNFEIEKYYQNEPRFNGVFARDNLPKKIKYETYVPNLDKYADVGTHLIALFCKRKEIVYFESCGVEYVPEEIK